MTSLVTASTKIEELVATQPDAVRILIQNGLPCVVCGEPFWGTLEELARQKGWDDTRIQTLVDQLNIGSE